jgi:hypothetical protein
MPPGSEEIEPLAARLEELFVELNPTGGAIIAALTLCLVLWLDRAPEPTREEIRRRVLKVIIDTKELDHAG